MNLLKTVYCGIEFPNPLILPSGIVQEIKDHQRAIDGGAGGITLKSLTVEKREGNPLPRVWKFDCGYINSVGLRNPGIEEGKKIAADFIRTSEVPVIISLWASAVPDFGILVHEISEIKPAIIELNLSCPNVTLEFGESLAMGSKTAEAAVRSAKKESGKIPLIAKLSPNVPGIGEIAKACESAGADGISAINTLGPGMLINIKTKKPYLGSKSGGVSGAAVKPVALRSVYDIYEAVKIPIIGTGGVSSWQDCVEMIMAGAALIGVGSITYTKGMGVYREICDGLKAYMEKEGVKNLTEIRGAAHIK